GQGQGAVQQRPRSHRGKMAGAERGAGRGGAGLGGLREAAKAVRPSVTTGLVPVVHAMQRQDWIAGTSRAMTMGMGMGMGMRMRMRMRVGVQAYRQSPQACEHAAPSEPPPRPSPQGGGREGAE